MSVIAKCAFGMTFDNLYEKDNPFMEKAKKVFSPPNSKTPLVVLPRQYMLCIHYLCPRLEYSIFFHLTCSSSSTLGSEKTGRKFFFYRVDVLHALDGRLD